MAFDNKRLKTFKWLDKLAKKSTSYKGIYIRYGSLYATNGIILVRVDYPELEHVFNDGQWRFILEYQDEFGMHLKFPLISPKIPNMGSRVFDDQFIGSCPLYYNCTQPFDAKIIAECMYPFKLYKIHPVIAHDGHKLEFTGHNRDVSIKVLMIGVTR